MELEEALAKIKRLEKQLDKKDKELEKLDDMIDANKKLEKQINEFKKEQEEITFKLKEKEKIEIFKELGFDEKQFNNLSKLTSDVENTNLKKVLESEEFEVFKNKPNSHLQTQIVNNEKEENAESNDMSIEDKIAAYMKQYN